MDEAAVGQLTHGNWRSAKVKLEIVLPDNSVQAVYISLAEFSNPKFSSPLYPLVQHLQHSSPELQNVLQPAGSTPAASASAPPPHAGRQKRARSQPDSELAVLHRKNADLQVEIEKLSSLLSEHDYSKLRSSDPLSDAGRALRTFHEQYNAFKSACDEIGTRLLEERSTLEQSMLHADQSLSAARAETQSRLSMVRSLAGDMLSATSQLDMNDVDEQLRRLRGSVAEVAENLRSAGVLRELESEFNRHFEQFELSGQYASLFASVSGSPPPQLVGGARTITCASCYSIVSSVSSLSLAGKDHGICSSCFQNNLSTLQSAEYIQCISKCCSFTWADAAAAIAAGGSASVQRALSIRFSQGSERGAADLLEQQRAAMVAESIIDVLLAIQPGCPGCKNPVELSQNCEHHHCDICRTHFGSCCYSLICNNGEAISHCSFNPNHAYTALTLLQKLQQSQIAGAACIARAVGGDPALLGRLMQHTITPAEEDRLLQRGMCFDEETHLLYPLQRLHATQTMMEFIESENDRSRSHGYLIVTQEMINQQCIRDAEYACIKASILDVAMSRPHITFPTNEVASNICKEASAIDWTRIYNQEYYRQLVAMQPRPKNAWFTRQRQSHIEFFVAWERSHPQQVQQLRQQVDEMDVMPLSDSDDELVV